MAGEVMVVGGGIGGLAAALRLQHAGKQVTLLEKNTGLGGKAGRLERDGFRWDTGPSLFTLPGILEDLYRDTGHSLSDHLTLQRLDPICRYFWRDGTVIDEDDAFFALPEVAAFLQYASGIYELSGEAYLHYPPDRMWRAFSPGNWPKLRHLPKVATFARLADEVDRRISDPHLRQLFKRYATYNGSSPFRTPATFNIIPYVEQAYGGWYPEGGIHRIIESLATLCREAGVRIRTGCRATAYDGKILEFRDEEDGTSHSVPAPCVVWNGDATTAYARIKVPGAIKKDAAYRKPERAHSGYVLLLGVDHQYPHLDHHNIFFSDDYRAEFQDIFEAKSPLPDDPTIYVNITSRTDPADAPADADNWFVLVNVPAETREIDWTTVGPEVEDRVLSLLEERGCTGLRQHLRVRESITPADFESRHLAHHGSLYGWASHSIRTSVLRPPLQSPLLPNLFFVGGTTHPGGGIPLVLLSAKMVAEMIRREES